MQRPKKSVEDINLIPLMNLFVTMIPLLLLTAAFYHIGMVSVSVPTIGEGGGGAVDTNKNAVQASVTMSDKGLSVVALNPGLKEEELKPWGAFIPKEGKAHDLKKLTHVLKRMKRKFQESDTMLLLPGKKSKYEEMVAVMDASRREVLEPLPGSKQKVFFKLFPVVVVTTLVE